MTEACQSLSGMVHRALVDHGEGFDDLTMENGIVHVSLRFLENGAQRPYRSACFRAYPTK